MVWIHNLGFSRMGARRELKFALESYWQGRSSLPELQQIAAGLRAQHWQAQRNLDLVPVGDFSLYDHVLDLSFTLGNVPSRFHAPVDNADTSCTAKTPLDLYFQVARGRSAPAPSSPTCTCGDRAQPELDEGPAAGEMTKWFNTNYHYIVPEFDASTRFVLDASSWRAQLAEARALDVKAKPVLVGPLTYLALGKSKDGTDRLALLPGLLQAYAGLLQVFADEGVEWVQLDEPLLVTELDAAWSHAFNIAYHQLKACPVKLLLATYFGTLKENTYLAAHLPVAGLHIDAVQGRDDVLPLLGLMPAHKVLSLGVIDGRNIWKTDLEALLEVLKPLSQRLGDRLWLAPSCSLLHVPEDLALETTMDAELRPWLAYARQKLQELSLLQTALNRGREAVADTLSAHHADVLARRGSPRVHRAAVQEAVARTYSAQTTQASKRSPYASRAAVQAQHLQLPRYPTTTIGSFPQTEAIRKARRARKSGELSAEAYDSFMRAEIGRAVREQEALGLDVLVHGEAERNDMVEYFGEQLEGYALSGHGWVQSYGSRCVKPPILFGDVCRPRAMTVDWIRHAQSLTTRPMKGMLTGPVTLLNWSFVRDDQTREQTCRQLALAVRDEVLDLERAGIHIIQIDEAALREGLPLRRSAWPAELEWAVACFRIAAHGVRDDTQIHTHMCYSEFNDILDAIVAMDADVITIETSRSDMALLAAFERHSYPNAIGPGVYDIHTPNVPTEAQMLALLRQASRFIPPDRLWVNPDCGLKTRRWAEVRPALQRMVRAAHRLRAEAQGPYPLRDGVGA